jgi:L-fucono-1,5-lactonase
MRIDSHQHFWRFNRQRDVWITDEMALLKRDFLPENLLPELKACGIDGCIAVQADQSEKETLFLLDLASRYAQIKGVVGWIDLRASELPERLQHFSGFEKLRGFRHVAQSEPDDQFLLQPDFARGIGQLADFGFTYDILIYPKQLPAATELVARFPKQRFVIDHMAKPSIRSGEFEPWSSLMRQMAGHTNVYCKISGLVTEAKWRGWRADDFKPYLDLVFEAFGCDRLMFGSDWPVCLLAGSYRDVAELIFTYISTLPRDQQNRVLGLNAIEFYRLKEQDGSGTSE